MGNFFYIIGIKSGKIFAYFRKIFYKLNPIY